VSGYPARHDRGPFPTHPIPAAVLTERAASAAVLRRTIRLHGQEVTFLEAGAECGGPVVALLHGLASSSTTWTRTVEPLGGHAHVIAPVLADFLATTAPAHADRESLRRQLADPRPVPA
jgi:pimeloyl-ACP methyl ester carboxylesterase